MQNTRTLIDILLKRQTEYRREEIAENAREAVRAFHAGELETETADQLISRLHAYSDEDDQKWDSTTGTPNRS